MTFRKPAFASAFVLGTLLSTTAIQAQIGTPAPVGVPGAAEAPAVVSPVSPANPAPVVAEAPVAETPAMPAVETPAEAPADAPVVAEAPAEGAVTPPPLPVEVTPPPLPAMPDYYVGVDGKPVGPLDEAALREMAAKGELTGDTLVWTEGMGDWTKAAEVTEVAALLEPQEDPGRKSALGVSEDEAKGAKPAPSPSPAPKADASGDATFVVGEWYVDDVITVPGMGEVDADIVQIFHPDGSYTASGTILTTVPGLGSTIYEVVVETTGTWTAVKRPDGNIDLVLSSTSTVTIPSLGYPPTTTSVVDEKSIVTVVDGDTIIDGQGIEWTRD